MEHPSRTIFLCGWRRWRGRQWPHCPGAVRPSRGGWCGLSPGRCAGATAAAAFAHGREARDDVVDRVAATTVVESVQATALDRRAREPLDGHEGRLFEGGAERDRG